MNVELTNPNPALDSLFKNPKQIITLDANFLIPPDRSALNARAFDFKTFQRIWLDPIFEVFPDFAIHEAVYNELILQSVKDYVDLKISAVPPQLIIHRDSSLSQAEQIIRDSIEEKIYPLTKYDPILNNKDDRGEIKSLSYIAVKGLLYFAAHDSNAIQLIEKAEKWETGLDNVQAIKMYEIIYYLFKTKTGDKKNLRILYKYQYHLTKTEKLKNPEWGQFIERMEFLYAK